MKICRSSGAVFIVLALASPVAALVAPSNTFELARKTFFANRVEEALPLFRAAARQSLASAERHAWVAEAARRAGDAAEALREARIALSLDPCHAFTHTILGDLFNPQFGGDSTNADSSWVHHNKAAACDPADGNAWLSLFYESMRMRDTSLERQALRALVRTGFVTPVHMTYARWFLGQLPPRAIVITTGDMDTYPLLAAQAAEGLRTDVTVLNESMLNLEWYIVAAFERHDLPRPGGTFDTTKILSKNFLDLFRAALTSGAMPRPFVFSITFGADSAKAGPGSLRLAGPYWLVTADSMASSDSARITDAFRSAEQIDWRGDAVAKHDRSPIRQAYPTVPAGLVALIAIVQGMDAAITDPGLARYRLNWAQSFLERAGANREYITAMLGGLREALK